jgi:hypothetical protein
VLLTLLASCGGSDQPSAAPDSTTPATQAATTTPATLASTTTAAPSRARQLQAALKRENGKVRSVSEDADGITIKTSYIFNYDNADAGVNICEAAKALVADDSFIEVMAVDNRWLARTTAFTGRCKATTLIR